MPLPVPLPLDSYISGNMILSTVKEEKLAALLGRWLIFEIEIWITNKIEPDAVSWSNFFRVGVMRHNVSVQF